MAKSIEDMERHNPAVLGSVAILIMRTVKRHSCWDESCDSVLGWAIEELIAVTNENSRLFKWAKSADEIPYLSAPFADFTNWPHGVGMNTSRNPRYRTLASPIGGKTDE